MEETLLQEEQEQFFRRLEERLLQPFVRKSAKEIADMLADDFIEFGSSGGIFNKQQIIDALQQESALQISLTDFSARILAADVVLVNYRAIRHGVAENWKVPSLRSSIWKLIEGRWQIVFHQGTPTLNAE